MGQVVVDDDTELLSGRIGFESDDAVTSLWDEKRKDFAESAFPTGTTSPFALRLDTLEMAFQTRPGRIRVESFVQAMQALLRESTGDDDWTVTQTRNLSSYEAWRQSVTRETRLRFRLRRPNPN